MLTASQIRDKFLSFFENNGHSLVSSSSLVPQNDPTLLFTNAGMVQFKSVFLGQEKRDYDKAVTSQKCLRVGGKHNDLENVGRTARHHTFFEMLGNFSFGDYFKARAIELAWDFLTRELGLASEKLYITIFQDDDEARDLWVKIAGVPENRIFRLGEKDNFWSMGDTGPCGPCSEILYDQGQAMSCGDECAIGVCDCDRYLEIWNLVFMQYDRDNQGNLNPLPRPSIDTGMGLERISAVCQGVFSNYDTDLFRKLIDHMAQLASIRYGQDQDSDVALRVIADHARAGAFMVADSILPSNEGRGYILRRLIRRAYRFGRSIGMRKPFLYKVAAEVARTMGDAYPELLETREFMEKAIKQEEERFAETLEKGLSILEDEISLVINSGKDQISGEAAFKLYDTYGFPLDIVNDIAEKNGLTVDEQGFNALMDEQKIRAKASWKGADAENLFKALSKAAGDGFEVDFVGYDHLKSQGRAAFLLLSNGEIIKELKQDQEGWIVSTTTPFYAESGGQVGDNGRIISKTGTARVLDTLKPLSGMIVHRVKVSQGSIVQDQAIDLTVDDGKRVAVARNHTVTHLLHAALRRVLGDHVRQAGSLVDENRLRFDFTHMKALDSEELQRIEDDVNASILADIPVETDEMEHEQAVQKGALALFGEKYADQVRVVSLGDVSMELCGGTHLQSTGQAGSFSILSEGGVAAGVRRIEAVTGWEALKLWQSNRAIIRELQALLKSRPEKVVNKVQTLVEELRQATRESKALQEKLSSGAGKELAASAKDIGGIRVIARKVDSPDMNSLRKLMDDIRSKMPSGAVMLAAVINEKPMLLLYVSKDLHSKYTAPSLIKEVAAEVKGSGGGRPELAQAGGSDIQGIDSALLKFETLLKDFQAEG
ncbi:alanine--tRNA ligase [Desulfonatronovibrio magnus]|uniref:alanine--tRNA ligase n=1 Tax=Desulfonatronovibrio magnus TaxID=698827 RepID=UPI0005EBA2EF|nr:alanine--tRNA ligase [Desulfonatronovibrio magnus]